MKAFALRKRRDSLRELLTSKSVTSDFTVARIINSNHLITCFLITTACHHYVESYLKFLLFLIKLSFSDTNVIESGRERKHSWDLKSFILGDNYVTLLFTLDTFYEMYITSLTRKVIFSKIWRAILVELLSPRPSLHSSETNISLEQV